MLTGLTAGIGYGLASVTLVCAWRGYVARLPGCEMRPYITHYGEEKPNLWYRVICYTSAWIDLLVPFTINLIGLVINVVAGKYQIDTLYSSLYYILAGAIVLATVLDITPRARRSTRGEGEEKGWFYIAVWTVVPTQLAGWAMWRLGRFMNLSPAHLGQLRLVAFVAFAAAFFCLGLFGKFPRTQRYIVPKGTISDVEVSAGA